MSNGIPEDLRVVIDLLLAANEANLVASLLTASAPEAARKASERSMHFRRAALSAADTFIDRELEDFWATVPLSLRSAQPQETVKPQFPCLDGPCAGDSLRVAPGAEFERVWLASEGGPGSVEVSTTGEIPSFPKGDRPIGYYALDRAKKCWSWHPFALLTTSPRSVT